MPHHITSHLLTLLQPEIDLVSKKRGHKRNSVLPNGSSNGKSVFALLVKVVTLHVSHNKLDIRGLCLKFILR